MENKRKLIRRHDLFIIIGLLVVTIVFASLSGRQSGVEVLRGHVYVGGVLVETLYLDDSEKSIILSRLPRVELSVSERGVAFIRSDCPDQVCVHTGWLNQPGQFAACIPNQVLLVIVGETGGQVDGITR